jgi:DNA replication protein DnaC
MAPGYMRDLLMSIARKRLVCGPCVKVVEEEERQRAQAAAEAEMESVKADPAGALKRCGVEERWLEAKFEACPDLPKPLRISAWQWSKAPDGFLFLSGIPGSGKTWLAVATMLQVMRLGVRRVAECRCLTERAFYAGIKRSYADPKEADVCRGQHVAASVPLLLYDDLGSARMTDWAREALAGLMEARHAACLPTIVTSNLDISAIGSAVDPRTASRLRESAMGPLLFPKVDLRMRRPER